MADTLTSRRLCCANDDITTPEDLSAKAGYVVKDEGGDYGSLLVTSTTFANRPLGVITYVEETTTADVTACTFRPCTVVEHGPATAIAGATITPGTDDLLIADGTGRLIKSGETAGGFWSVGSIDSESGDAVTVGLPFRMLVNPQWINILAGED